ncbi:cysteine--tRNA ligase [Planotetraspora phitsanulokensis]|uniref:Cysteine--tRNA ligase n=1 Tax=Planotetraspora phitsanulokensis TaxID=575192 RepID=A0A8J3U2D0_9ACTN|nr:cysteine--tRNA ligase [Planotetraspora phitsanulokensis]GII37298.1 cysteine--tRNA ligase [Planotetraspora phitsanulokensis]
MLRVYDTRAGQVEPVVATGSRVLRMYVCGPPAHRYAHLGDLRSLLLADLVRRVAERRGPRVVACRSVADVSGHGEAASASDGKPPPPLYEDAFRADALALNIRTPEHTPRESENLDTVIELITRLIELGRARPAPDGSVYFDADPRWPLWTAAVPAWDSPWGPGAPGPHVGCSALSARFLGGRVDLYAGGADRHQEGVRAESGAAAGRGTTAPWLHGGPLLFEGRPANGPDPVLLSDVTAEGLDPLAVRLALMGRHHREQADLTGESLRAAARTLRRWRRRVADWAESPSRPIDAGRAEAVQRALDDDLDMPRALRILHDLEDDGGVAPGSRFETFLHFDHVLGLDLSIDIGKVPTLPPGAGELLRARERAQEEGDWAASDRLRDDLAELGVKVADTPTGQSWSL